MFLFQRLFVGILMLAASTSATDLLPSTVFWDNQWPTDTTGELEGTVLFAQGQIMPSKNRVPGDDTQPHLTALRKTLVMFKPFGVADDSPMQMTVIDKYGAVLGSIDMEHPNKITKHDGWIPNVDPNLSFPNSLTGQYILQGNTDLRLADDESGDYMMSILNDENKEVEAIYRNGAWSRNLYLPPGDSVPSGSVVLVTCNSGYNVNVKYPNTVTGGWRTKTLSNGNQATLVVSNGALWVAEDDLEHNEYIFGHDFWTAIMEPKWVKPGVTIDFQQGLKEGSLTEVDVGGETELIITAIDVGLLTEPRNQFSFKDDESTNREYFQTTPASRMIVAQYETLHLTEVMLPTGVLYTESSPDTGGWHSGDMRGYTGKLLISHGIDLANYGISSSFSASESSHPFSCAMLAAHNTVGMYANGRVVHGGSGGNGMITLDSSIGNEMSHEAGHNYGLGHYVRGFVGSVHRSADSPGSTWGWDSDLNIFVPNFYNQDSSQDQCCCSNDEVEQCESPFLGKYKYGKDAMAGGGGGHWGTNRYTLYTPNSYSRIQSFLEGKLSWHSDSATGFVKYNPSTKEMEEHPNPNNGKVPRLFGVAVTTIVGYYDPIQEMVGKDYIFPALHGAYGFVYDGDGAPSASGCELRVQTSNTGTQVFWLWPERYQSSVMNKFHVNIATENAATNAEVWCNGKLLVTKILQSPKGELTYTVNGEESEPRTFEPTNHPSAPPSVSPSFVHQWGLEKYASLEVVLPAGPDGPNSWPGGFPSQENKLIEEESEYYAPNERPDIDIDLDFGREATITGAYCKTWYVTRIGSIQVGIAPDDGASYTDPPNLPDSGWQWFDLGSVSGGYNAERDTIIPHLEARYVKYRFRGGTSSYGSNWGLRHIQISGNLPATNQPSSHPTKSPSVSPSFSPSNSPSFVHQWGLEKQASLEVVLPVRRDGLLLMWPIGFPSDENKLTEVGSEYYVPLGIPDIDIDLDFGREAIISGAYFQTWYVTRIGSIQVGIAPDDGASYTDPPNLPDNGWQWFDLDNVTGWYNNEREVVIPHVLARYVKYRFRGGASSYGSNWGLRQIQISGYIT